MGAVEETWRTGIHIYDVQEGPQMLSRRRTVVWQIVTYFVDAIGTARVGQHFSQAFHETCSIEAIDYHALKLPLFFLSLLRYSAPLNSVIRTLPCCYYALCSAAFNGVSMFTDSQAGRHLIPAKFSDFKYSILLLLVVYVF